jgi:hypothetical protein
MVCGRSHSSLRSRAQAREFCRQRIESSGLRQRNPRFSTPVCPSFRNRTSIPIPICPLANAGQFWKLRLSFTAPPQPAENGFRGGRYRTFEEGSPCAPLRPIVEEGEPPERPFRYSRRFAIPSNCRAHSESGVPFWTRLRIWSTPPRYVVSISPTQRSSHPSRELRQYRRAFGI